MLARLYQIHRFEIPDQHKGRFQGKTLETISPLSLNQLKLATAKDLEVPDEQGQPVKVRTRLLRLEDCVLVTVVEFPKNTTLIPSAA